MVNGCAASAPPVLITSPFVCGIDARPPSPLRSLPAAPHPRSFHQELRCEPAGGCLGGRFLWGCVHLGDASAAASPVTGGPLVTSSS